ncbi:malto-oligosyltrehalose trehalohydrolase [Bosea sp. BK604]|uniref:malto-oligosyltrehalose trehalohydrolase n=1 Tax=Bosea sp. BK604 TaxID=2512180 RepID=UPI001043A2BF|nr:malto-oligosyltrehalose trehalohydrolase [Bosea sp. BK604]TCR68275.1 maltooligosyl trehalose hydrolase [Bosea sp. BK604]
MRRGHQMPFGAALAADGVRFGFWAPSASRVTLLTHDREEEMVADDGWFRLHARALGAGALYSFRVDGEATVPDPASRFQPRDIGGPSMVVDPFAYRWRDGSWRGRLWEEAVVYEAHVGTATPEGSFTALTGKLEYLRDLGVTALELMPIADFPGSRSWGYDGVLHYAPDHAYGTPDELKALVDEAHSLGLMVLLDVVYNHFGPSGNYLPTYAQTFFTERHQTLWGAGINYDGETSATVREYFINNALYWLEEYHFDGLRFDAVHAIADDSEKHIIAELAERIRASFPQRHVHLVLENNANEARWLGAAESGTPGLYTAQWNDDIHHAWHRILTGESDGYYRDYDNPVARLGRGLAEGFIYQGEHSQHDGVARGEPSGHLPPSAFVAFLQNHDQIGNRALGERLGLLTDQNKLALARAALLLGPQIPLLFMGEEWQASTPFVYFVDFPDDPDLANAVREGRRKEFGGFAAFGDETGIAAIPDPTTEETFARSRLNWDEALRDPHSSVLAETKALLHLRRDEVVPLTKTGLLDARWRSPGADALEICWRFGGGSLRLLMNFGPDIYVFPVESGERAIWSSPGVALDGDATLPPWTGTMLVGK